MASILRPVISLVAALIIIPSCVAAPAASPDIVDGFIALFAEPTVVISQPKATIVGLSPRPTTIHTEEFPGIPFALPPLGELRLKPPQPITQPMGKVLAQKNANVCPQFVFSNDIGLDLPFGVLGLLTSNPVISTITGQSEDCLALNVHRPRGTKKGDKLPVLFWIFGGGFELGWNSMYSGGPWVDESVRLGKPIIMVTVGYRVGGYGFLGGKELAAEGSTNLGLLDQRLGLQWVADNIADFGGDPDRVTIWGESAGSISVFDHLIAYDGDHTYKGKPLFHGAIMNSGTAVPTDPVDSPKAQAIYDRVVNAGGCAGSQDTLACLRKLPYDKFNYAVSNVRGLLSYSALALSYLPRPDGKFLTASPDVLGVQGKFAKVPFITGAQEDEGTLFALLQGNLTTKDDVVTYLKEFFFTHASEEKLNKLVSLYDNIDEYGAPHGTGNETNWYPQFKRMAGLIGDAIFTLTRRSFLKDSERTNPDVPFYSYLSSYFKGAPIIGTTHGTDILQVFYGLPDNYAAKAFREYYINFVNYLDPNAKRSSYLPEWPRWDTKDKTLLHMFADKSGTLKDDFRQDVLDLLTEDIGDFYF